MAGTCKWCPCGEKKDGEKTKGGALFVLVCVFEGRHNNNKKKEKRGELRERKKGNGVLALWITMPLRKTGERQTDNRLIGKVRNEVRCPCGECWCHQRGGREGYKKRGEGGEEEEKRREEEEKKRKRREERREEKRGERRGEGGREGGKEGAKQLHPSSNSLTRSHLFSLSLLSFLPPCIIVI